MEIINIEEENLSLYLLNDLMNFNAILRKYVAYNNIKSHKIAGFIVSVENAFLEKPEGEGQIEPPPLLSLFRVKIEEHSGF